MNKKMGMSITLGVAINICAWVLFSFAEFDWLNPFFSVSEWITAAVLGGPHDSVLAAFIFLPMMAVVNVILTTGLVYVLGSGIAAVVRGRSISGRSAQSN